MTRLDSAIRRLMAQRALLDWAAADVAQRPAGLILELGPRQRAHLRPPARSAAGAGRSTSSNAAPAAHPDCMPQQDRLVVGDIFETLPDFLRAVRPGLRRARPCGYRHGRRGRNRAARGPARAARRTRSSAPGGLLLARSRRFRLPGCADVSAEAGVDAGPLFRLSPARRGDTIARPEPDLRESPGGVTRAAAGGLRSGVHAEVLGHSARAPM